MLVCLGLSCWLGHRFDFKTRRVLGTLGRLVTLFLQAWTPEHLPLALIPSDICPRSALRQEAISLGGSLSLPHGPASGSFMSPL